MATSRSSNGIGRHSQRSTLLKVVILGDGGVGKSCLMNRFVSNHFDEQSFHTIGVEFLNKDIEINGESYTLQIWDTAGQERFKTLRTPFYRGSDICLLTYAVDDPVSFKNLNLWKSEFLYYADVPAESSFPFIIVGNKVDVPESEKRVTTEEAEQWCSVNGGLPLVETSAKDATNVETAFSAAVAAWAKLEARVERPLLEDTVDLSKQQNAYRSSCCLPSFV
ncbi:ras-related protein Rab-9A [Trichogramma pretiosum]|uniref:ras-related protein Rab-9A n=1 Tax=Trichogramma pretiosum TaxID=7493 RepID=UPI0006C965E0|nr:ras-related protein Rab-9A [Trichogramma pretiosum]